MAREPTTLEVEKGLQTFFHDHDLPMLQKSILITDEYANFK
jgi:hypothetical protein